MKCVETLMTSFLHQIQMMNLIQWEQQIKFSPEEEEVIAYYERLEQPVQQVVRNENIVSSDTNLNFEDFFPPSRQHQDATVTQIEEVLSEYQQQLKVFQTLLTNLGIISQQLHQLELNNQQVVNGITAFHGQSSSFISQQKAMMEMQQKIQEYLQYYSVPADAPTFEESDLQRRMSEITDGIVFFNSNAQFRDSARYFDAYKAQRKRLIASVKNHLFRLMNREFAFTNASKGKYNDVLLSLFYPSFLASDAIAPPNPMKLQFLQTLFPQLMPTLQIYDDKGTRVSLNIKFDEQMEKFHISDALAGFCHFMESQLAIDQEIYDLFNDVFLEFRGYCRLNLHQSINDQIAKQLATQQLGTTLIRMKSQLVQGVPQRYAEPLIFETLVSFVFEVFLNEAIYFRTVFEGGSKLVDDRKQALLTSICETYQLTIRTFIHKNNHLDILLQCATMMKSFIAKVHAFTPEAVPSNHYLSVTVKALGLKCATEMKQALVLFDTEILEKTRIDLMQRIVAMCHVDIQEQIYNFNLKEYLKRQGKLQIFKFIPQGHQMPKFYTLQRDETYPTVAKGVQMIIKLAEFLDRRVFEQLAGEILREINTQVKDVAAQYELKFDSYLFFIKQLLALTSALLPLGATFIIKEQELDFTETKTILLQLISGQIRPNIKWVELTSAEKLWSYTTNFFAFIYNGMPKLNQYEVDLKQTMVSQLKNVTFQFVKDMTFVICKAVIDFLRKYQFLQYILGNEEAIGGTTITKEQAGKDLEVLLQHETVSKAYVFFIDNLYEFTDEMVSKLNNYCSRETFDKISIYILDIIQNSVSLLSQFYIVVSKHCNQYEYDRFEFKSIDEVSKVTHRKIQFIEQ